MPTIAFDFLGTLAEFDHVVETMWQLWHDSGVATLDDAQQLFESWYDAACRDYLATSHAGIYRPLSQVLQGSLARAVLQHRRRRHRSYDMDDGATKTAAWVSPPSADEVQIIMDAFQCQLTPISTALDAIHYAVDKGWHVWIVTQASQQDTAHHLQINNYPAGVLIMSCDDLKVAKPHAKVYAQVMRRTVQLTQKIEPFYMVSRHAWDLEGAKNASMHTAFITDTLQMYGEEIYGRVPDILGSDVLDCVEKIIEHERGRQSFFASLL
ncbi:HAD-like domain-containing protein [Gongronella butleri]|nr:HAD-like domain-containing protein [Gongronella butleri]